MSYRNIAPEQVNRATIQGAIQWNHHRQSRRYGRRPTAQEPYCFNIALQQRPRPFMAYCGLYILGKPGHLFLLRGARPTPPLRDHFHSIPTFNSTLHELRQRLRIPHQGMAMGKSRTSNAHPHVPVRLYALRKRGSERGGLLRVRLRRRAHRTTSRSWHERRTKPAQERDNPAHFGRVGLGDGQRKSV